MNQDKIIRGILILVGISLCAIGINGFLTPAQLLSTGLAGIVVILDYLFNVNQGIIILLFNIPIFIYSKKYVDKSFFTSSLINMFIYSAAIGLTENISQYINFDDVLIQAIFGGLFVGLGVGLLFKANSSVGGLDIVSAILKLKYGIDVSKTFLLINSIIVVLGGVLFGPRLAMYTLISMYVTSVALNVAKDCFNKQKSILLVTDSHKEIANDIMHITKKGVTYLEAEGAYSNQKKKLIYCIVSTSQVAKIKEIVYKIDEKAFISINDVDEVRGGGFRAKNL